MLFLLIYNTGMRIAEALSVDVGDVELDKRRILITGKGSKERFVFFSPSTVDEIRVYLSRRDDYLRERGIDDEKAFFIGKRGGRLPFSSAHIIFDEYNVFVYCFGHLFKSKIYKKPKVEL